MKKDFSAHYISGTHWDREWYRPFQEFRVLLVKLLDDLLDIMERDHEFKYFQLDGQTCILDDYLEIRPENRERLQALISEGRILAGPWFTMPDLFCVGDEALVRNLLMGRRICREWNVEPMPVGFICDMFGHPSQMAQIFAGFDIHDVVLGRGTNESTTPMYFNWEAPDGSTAFTFKLQDAQGYGAFARPRATLEEANFFFPMPGFRAELEAATDDAKRLAVREKWFRIELAQYVNHEMQRANGDVVCLMDSMDHIPPATEVPRYLRLIEEASDSVRPQHSNLPLFFEDARANAGELPTKVGELREPSQARNDYLWLIPNCVSARARIKLANDAAQNLLEKQVEPMLALANLHGAKIPERYLQVAWRHLLLNQAHDSICGCSIDQVHRDMMYRFEQAQTLGETLREQCLEVLTAGAPDLAQESNEFTLVLYNATPMAREEVVEFDIDLPPDYAADFSEGFFGQKVKAFRLWTADGEEVPYQRLGFVPVTNERSRLPQFCFQSDGPFTRYRVAARVALPGLGYAALRVAPSPTPVRPTGDSLRTGPTAAENNLVAIAIDPNGTLTLTDKANGQTYTDLLLWEDSSEVGDGWFHCPTVNEEQILSSASRAQVSLLHEGPEQVTFRVTTHLEVPDSYNQHSERRDSHTVSLKISSDITLRRGAGTVEVETTVHNNARNHRLRLLLPTDATNASSWLAHHPFDFVERSIAVDPQTHDWQEMEIAEKPFLHVQAVGDGERGLAFLSNGGLHEGGVMDDARRTMQVTLLRAFSKTVSTGGEEGGQEQGTFTFRYALMPYTGELPRTEAMQQLALLQTPVLTRQSGRRPSGFPALGGDAAQCGLLEVSGELVVSAIKSAEAGGGLIVRLWNPSAARAQSTLAFDRTLQDARALKLNEDADTEAPSPRIEESVLHVEAAPHRAVTFTISF